MSNSGLVNYIRISPNRTIPRDGTIKNIVIHHMAGNLTVETCGNVFAPRSRRASSNYGIGSDGRVGMYVEEKDRAWTTGNKIDHSSVTIEVADDVIGNGWHSSDKAMNKLIELCADICRRNGIAKLNYTGGKSGNLLMHKWYQATDCPGAYLESKFPWIANEVNKRLSGNTDPDGEVKTGGTVQTKKDETGEVNYNVHTRGNGWMNQRCDGDMAGTTGQNRRVEAIKLWLKNGTIKSVTVHVKSDGDKTYNNPTKDTVIGTTGQKKRIEAIKIESDIPLRYRVHQKKYGWSEWKNKGEFAGVKGESKQIEAIEIYKPIFLVRGHIQSSGWGSYVGEKEQIGTTGKSKRLEALQINPLNEKIECSAHIQGEGWVHYGVITKDTVIGTVDQADRLECLRFKGNFEFRVHIQGSGWTNWTEADGIATLGTTGQALRIEAIQFRRK